MTDINKEETELSIKIFFDNAYSNFPELKTYIDNNLHQYEDEGYSRFYPDFQLIIDYLTEKILNSENEIIKKILDYIEFYLSKTPLKEVKNRIQVFFFDTIVNRLGNKGEVYIRKFISMLGPESRQLCKNEDLIYRAETAGLWAEGEFDKALSEFYKKNIELKKDK